MPPRESTKERAPGWGRGREKPHDGTTDFLLFLSLGRSEGRVALPRVPSACQGKGKREDDMVGENHGK